MQNLPICPLPRHMHSFPKNHTPHQGGTFVTSGEPTLTHRYCSKSIISIRVCSDGIHSIDLLWPQMAKLSSKVALPFCIPTSSVWDFLFPSPSALGSVNALDFGHSHRHVAVSHCCFHLHFPDDRMWSVFSCDYSLFVYLWWGVWQGLWSTF